MTGEKKTEHYVESFRIIMADAYRRGASVRKLYVEDKTQHWKMEITAF